LLESNIGELHEGICLIVNYVLSTGQKGTLPLNKKQCKYFLDCIDKNKTMILQVGDEIRTLNPVHVAFTYVKGLNVDEIKVKTEAVKETVEILDHNEELIRAYNTKDTFFIECLCGEEYQLELIHHTKKYGCRKCSKMVFLDRKRGKQLIENNLVWIMSNKYFVDREVTYIKTV
jgi:hypothetical protein